MTKKARVAQMKLMRLKLLQDIESARRILDKLEDSERKARDFKRKNCEVADKDSKQ